MARVPSLKIFRHQAYRYYWIARQLISAGRQMVAVAIGWQIYDLARETRSVEESAFLLGLVGLTQFLPVLMLSLVAGQAADRIDRKLILVASNIVRIAVIGGLFAASYLPASLAIPAIFVAAAIMGGVNAFTPPASTALYPQLVPRDELPLAIAWNSLGFQGAAILGPAIGGFLYIGGPQLVYAVAGAIVVVAVLSFLAAKTPAHEPVKNARGLKMIFEGLRYVRDNKIVLGAISLDLVVVFFGGVTALLPVFARDVLHVGAEGLGLLRAAPAFGAGIVAAWMAVNPLSHRVGLWMLAAIAVYGAAMLGFAVSTLFWLSMAMLALTGAADMISMYIRMSLIQLATPDGMRGRVSSVSYIFISASNELGEFESGVAARFLGPVGAVLLGGAVAIASALAWVKLFPSLATADKFEDEAAVEKAQAPKYLE
ncbi:MFS transporter [Hyphococcus flavus]|uniref:MFS transporter n=1 Tax=Hyphococcus flavus TaxID=1866326 RepID=A0AAE9ZFA8_9PROT|nr:MFS transporter [Hyphococcus flavus]WDI32735.1 MFS transporter [Hyphococcus flavus]